MVSVSKTAGPAEVMWAGVDWAKDDHVVCVVDGAGRVVERVTVSHQAAGLARLVRVLGRYAVASVHPPGYGWNWPCGQAGAGTETALSRQAARCRPPSSTEPAVLRAEGRHLVTAA